MPEYSPEGTRKIAARAVPVKAGKAR